MMSYLNYTPSELKGSKLSKNKHRPDPQVIYQKKPKEELLKYAANQMPKEEPVKPEIRKSWPDAEKTVNEILSLSSQIEVMLTPLSEKYKTLEDLVLKAYQQTPLTDCGLNVSPLGLTMVRTYMLNHLKKRGVALDNRYVAEIHKINDMTHNMKEACKWLLKFKKDEVTNVRN